jgi:hypothetical protein
MKQNQFQCMLLDIQCQFIIGLAIVIIYNFKIYLKILKREEITQNLKQSRYFGINLVQ